MTLDRWLLVIGVVLSGLVTWFVSRYYYRRSDRKRTPTFIVQSVKALVDSRLYQMGGFLVSWGRSEVGTNGISEAIIAFWNSGTLPILAEEILEPYTVTTKNVPIFEYSVLKSSRDVIGVKLSRLGEDGDRLELGFSVLEPGDGATIRLVFDGPPTTKIVFSGACLECRKPTILPPDPIYSVPIVKRFRKTYGELVLFLLVSGAFGGAVAGLFWVAKRLFGEHGQQIVGLAFLGLVGLMMVSLAGAALWAHFKHMTAPYLPPDIKE